MGERRLIGLEIVQLTVEKVHLIGDCLRASQSKQKSYVDNKRRSLDFQVGDRVPCFYVQEVYCKS